MDNNVIKTQSKDPISDPVKADDVSVTRKSSAGAEDKCADRSVIELKQDISVVNLLDSKSPAKGDVDEPFVKSEPLWLQKYEVCEDLDAEMETAKKEVKRESLEASLGSKDTKATEAGESKGGELKTELCMPDTLILQIDNTDNLDVYLDRTRSKTSSVSCKGANTEGSNKTDLQKDANASSGNDGKSADCTVTLNKNETNPSLENNASDWVHKEEENIEPTSSNTKSSSKKKTPNRRAAKKSNTNKKASPKPAKKSLESTETELPFGKNSDTLKAKTESDSIESLRKKIKVEPESKNEPAVEVQKDAEKPEIEEKLLKSEKEDEKLACDASGKTIPDKCDKSEDKKSEPRFIWISNISKSTKATDLKLHLSSYGKVVTARIVTDGKLYYGYVVMEKREDVDNCIKNLDDTSFESKKIRLSAKGPEKKSNKSEGDSKQDITKIEKDADTPKDDNSENTATSAPKLNKDNEDIVPRRRRSRSHDPLTLKVRKDVQRFNRFSEERRRRRIEDMLRKSRERRSQEKREMLRRKRELEREREERRRQRIKEEEYKQTELKLERERRKLEHERQHIERERLELLRLQKKLADSERSMLNRQKIELERNLRNIKRRSPEDFDRKSKFPRSDVVEPRRHSENKEYWKSERERRTSPLKIKTESFNIETYPPKKVTRDETACVAAPPPPILSDNFDLTDRRRKEKEREWGTRTYDKKEYPERPIFKDSKVFERKIEDSREYPYPERRDTFLEKAYNRDRYKPKDFGKFEKAPATTWDKFSSAPYKSVSGSWRNDAARPVQRHQHQHQASGFPAPQFGPTTAVPHYYPESEYGRASDFYGRPPERKY